MNFNSYILEQALRRLQLSEDAIRQFQLAGKLSDVEGRGFPKELFQLSAPVIMRGLLNFAVLQMQRDWLHPYWVHRQLNPADESYIPRGQNPLLINVTHRNWTAVGTLNGFYEAIVDPRGLATPLPREWSVDTWIILENGVFFPSLASDVDQTIQPAFPCLTTRFAVDELGLSIEHFASPTNHDVDVLFTKTLVRNNGSKKKTGALCVAIRPFNPEGVAPIFSVEFRSPRIAQVNKATGVVFAETPDRIFCSSRVDGDLANLLQRNLLMNLPERSRLSSQCEDGLAHAVAMFTFELAPDEAKSVHYSVALGNEKELQRTKAKQTWRVSFDKRKSDQEAKWRKEISAGARFEFAESSYQALFDASRLTLLQLNDGDFISPGPFLYHHFWYRDAALMVRALSTLGFRKRSRDVIDAFPRRLQPDGFFRGPDGEWDSNGAVIWSVHQHYLLHRQHLWLNQWYPHLMRAAQWILRKRKQSENGLMPPGLSAEHLGTVDQYFWDSFWSLAGLQSMVLTATALNKKSDAELFDREFRGFEQDILKSFSAISARIGEEVIPATPRRSFDESAIGSISCIYPLELFNRALPHPRNTLEKLADRFVDGKGFFHPIVHSGYNPYLTLQIAHSFLTLGEVDKAWEVAEAIFRQAAPPYSLPEAIHPKTGGGTMGDGHHGWAAAEIILFLRDCMVREKGETITLFGGNAGRLLRKGKNAMIQNVPTRYGALSCSLTFMDETSATIALEGNFAADVSPSALEIHLPFDVKTAAASSPNHISVRKGENRGTVISCSPKIRTLFLKL